MTLRRACGPKDSEGVKTGTVCTDTVIPAHDGRSSFFSRTRGQERSELRLGTAKWAAGGVPEYKYILSTGSESGEERELS